MKKMQMTIIIILCASLLLLAGCAMAKVFSPKGNGGKNIYSHPAANLSYGGDPVEFEHFVLTISGMSREHDRYEATKKGNGVLLAYYIDVVGDKRRLVRAVEGDAALYKKLCELLGNCRINKWNGFSGPNPPHILDGYSMSFQAKLADGSQVSAGGSNNFPANYGTLKRTLHDMATLLPITSSEFSNGRYAITLPESWINTVTARFSDSYVAFTIRDNKGEKSFFIIDDATYGYYPAGTYSNIVRLGRLLKDNTARFITARDNYNLKVDKQLPEAVQRLAATYAADRKAILDSFKPVNGYRFAPEDGSVLYEADARKLFDKAKGLWLDLAFAGDYKKSVKPISINGRDYIPLSAARKGVKSMEELRQSFLDFFSVEFTDKVLAEAQAHKDLIVVDGNTYVAYNKSANRADFINSWVNSVRDDGNGHFSVLVKLRKRTAQGQKTDEQTLAFPTEKLPRGGFVFTGFPYWEKVRL